MIDFAKKLKTLRRIHNITQEQLAGYLCVSSQAVSRWECGTACPDISLLPQISEFFEITVDELLGVDEQEKRREIDEIIAETSAQIDRNLTEKPICMLRDALMRYPNNDRLLCTLMYGLFAASEDEAFCKAHDAEIISIADRIFTYSQNRACRDEARRLLFRHYCDTDRKAEARTVLEDMPLIEVSRERNMYWMLEGEERLDHLKERIGDDMRYLIWDIWAYSEHADISIEEKQALEALYRQIEGMVNQKFA